MSRFPLPMNLRNLADGSRFHWQLISPFVYIDRVVGNVIVPAGFMTDLASVPKFAWPLFDPTNDAAPMSLPHDWLYAAKGFVRPGVRITRAQTDAILYRALRCNGVGYLRARVMWLAVRLAAGSWWKKGESCEAMLTPSIIARVEESILSFAGEP